MADDPTTAEVEEPVLPTIHKPERIVYRALRNWINNDLKLTKAGVMAALEERFAQLVREWLDMAHIRRFIGNQVTEVVRRMAQEALRDEVRRAINSSQITVSIPLPPAPTPRPGAAASAPTTPVPATTTTDDATTRFSLLELDRATQEGT